MRRVSLALLVSLGVHVGLVVAALGITAWRGLSFARDVEIVPITLESVRDLPLGAPPAASKRSTGVIARPPRHPRVAPPQLRPRVAIHTTGSLPTENRDGGAPPAAQAAATPPPDARPTAPPPKPG